MASSNACSGLPEFPNFKVHKLLGKGSYGKVYKVERKSDKQLYALKEADLGSMSQAERADAVNEVRLLVSISHHNVIRYNEVFLLGNRLCTVMEYAPFGDLRYYIGKAAKRKTPFPEQAVWRLFLQLCRGLHALHSQNVLHRDIKPANIFLCVSDMLKIGDLGIAKALTNINFARTQIGTPCYMAPDRTPAEGRSIVELRNRIVGGRFAPITSAAYSQELVTLCYSLLSTEPSKRPSAASILASTVASKWKHVLPAPPVTYRPPARRWTSDGSSKGVLLDTIVVPRDLKQLPKHLPLPSYDTDDVAQATPPPAQVAASAASTSAVPSGGQRLAASSCDGAAVPHYSRLQSAHAQASKPASRACSPAVTSKNRPGSRPVSREKSRAPSPAEIRSILDYRKGHSALSMQVPLPPLYPRSALYGGCISPAAVAAASAASAAIAAYQQRWAPTPPSVAVNMPRSIPPRRISIT